MTSYPEDSSNQHSGNLKSYRHIRSTVPSETPTNLIRKIFKSEQVIWQRFFKDKGYTVSTQTTMHDKQGKDLEGDISVLLKSILLIFQPVIIANNSGEI
jgi:hypothetical protein